MIVSENGFICSQNRNSNNKNNKQQEKEQIVKNDI